MIISLNLTKLKLGNFLKAFLDTVGCRGFDARVLRQILRQSVHVQIGPQTLRALIEYGVSITASGQKAVHGDAVELVQLQGCIFDENKVHPLTGCLFQVDAVTQLRRGE